MATAFDPAWLAMREPFDEAALERGVIASLRAWAGRPGPDSSLPIRVVDLGSGTGVALRRAARWLAPRSIDAYAVDTDPALLAAASTSETSRTVTPILADVLAPLAPLGGPEDGSVDLVLGHALADLLPLDRLAQRTAALLRPRGLAHLALTYDGETAFEPIEAPALEAHVIAAYHRHMDRPRAADPTYGGSLAGLRLANALEAAGLEIVRAGPAVWDTRQTDQAIARPLLDRMIRFVVESLLHLGEPSAGEVRGWERSRRVLLDADCLSLRVRHLDLLARRPA
ncbi:MAG: class I SAM-dependent methyltransferase [Chloroflexi bacterium]|nr:class I SAM-dependent methyltransferase [Chloroflexota bacterium]